MAFVLGSHGHGHESVHQAGEKAYVMEVPRLASPLTFTNSHLPFLNMVCLHLPTLYTYHGIAANTAVPILPPSYSFAHLAKPRGMPAIPTHGSTTVEAEAHFCSYQLIPLSTTVTVNFMLDKDPVWPDGIQICPSCGIYDVWKARKGTFVKPVPPAAPDGEACGAMSLPFRAPPNKHHLPPATPTSTLTSTSS
jgi:hypothetical protein